ncbi:MAG: Holliday junction resolvase RuvX [Pseudomonadota bacterium]|nr:Holliday junction resolvase RuvX [Pseudomonadota bacterium]
MAIFKPSDLRAAVPEGARLLGLDLGERTIGLAVSDGGWRVDSAVGTWARGKFSKTVDALLVEVDARAAGGLVLGLPLDLDGGENRRSQATRDWARELLTRRDLPIALWDERLSTQAVDRIMLAEDMTRQRRKARKDTLAATYVLQGFLDAHGA